MRRLLIPAVLFLFWLPLHAGEVYRQVRIFVPDRAFLTRIWDAGLDFEGASGKPGGWMEFAAGEGELAALASAGITWEVTIPDMAEHYRSQLSPRPENVLGFGLGSMGGNYTFAEAVAQLDTLALLFPGLVTAKQAIGTTAEGRTVWAVKISDFADQDEDEPEVLYTALTHAREPPGMMTLFYYMWWLLENYETSSEANYLVTTREMWFIPVVNPDGYVYNQTTNPSGGGMWRKNRRNNGGSYGVDLNRNWGPYYMWNAPNGGSSTTPSSDTYRGPSEFSEPETNGINLFMRGRQFKTALNYHTFGNYLINPYGYLSRESGDSLMFRDWAYQMTWVNRYTNGTDQQTVSYSTRGNSDDYMYGDSTKPRTYAMTSEVGTAGFWASTGTILPLAQENLRANKHLAYIAGHWPEVRHHRVLEADSNESLIRGEPFVLGVTLRNTGVGDAANLTVMASCPSGMLTFSPGSALVASLPAQTAGEVFLSGSVSASAPGAGIAEVILDCLDPQGFSKRDTLRLYLGSRTLLFSDNASGGTGNWNTGTGWGTSSHAHTPPSSFTDSPSGRYAASANNSLTLQNAINLTGYQHARLRFRTMWAIEPTWDFVTVEASTDNGSTWALLRTGLSRPGSARSGSKQPAGSWGYDSYTPGLTWSEQSADLSPYVGRQVKVRFRLASDGGEERDGVYVDDIRMEGYRNLLPPPAPALVEPMEGAAGLLRPVTFRWREMEEAQYGELRVGTDSLLSAPVFVDTMLTDTVRTVAGLETGTRYFWNVRGRNAAGAGGFSATRSLTTASPVTAPYGVLADWNLVSLPLLTEDARPGTLFPQAVSPAFGFDMNSGYVTEDTLRRGAGYWLKFDSARTVSLTGFPVLAETVALAPGWNLIGGVFVPVDTASVVQTPAGLLIPPFYGFGAGYAEADSLRPMQGYWVKARQAGSIVITSGGTAPHAADPGEHRKAKAAGRAR
ncbi:MAG: M14 family zinc carboxypeptidase [Bacteroidota bacterium]